MLVHRPAARVVVNLRIASLVEAVAFERSSYNFSVPENEPSGKSVGKVWAFSGNDLYDVTYTLKTHTGLFSVDSDGAVLTTTQLDKEEQEWYILDVEAVDTRTPPTSAMAMVSPLIFHLQMGRKVKPDHWCLFDVIHAFASLSGQSSGGGCK